MAEEREVGAVSHYYTKIGVAVIELTDTLKVGDNIHIKGATSDFTQKVDSMQIEHKGVDEAKKGESIGLKVKEHARGHDKVFVVEK
ncbi:hypothetical protein KY348_01240 [Candidatus Woesearchaeota archaeon]|nr:hypothetical protein [Candidatus Woesearchaeota archaeon]